MGVHILAVALQQCSLVLVLPGLVASLHTSTDLCQILPKLLILLLQAVQGGYIAVPQIHQFPICPLRERERKREEYEQALETNVQNKKERDKQHYFDFRVQMVVCTFGDRDSTLSSRSFRC